MLICILFYQNFEHLLIWMLHYTFIFAFASPSACALQEFSNFEFIPPMTLFMSSATSLQSNLPSFLFQNCSEFQNSRSEIMNRKVGVNTSRREDIEEKDKNRKRSVGDGKVLKASIFYLEEQFESSSQEWTLFPRWLSTVCRLSKLAGSHKIDRFQFLKVCVDIWSTRRLIDQNLGSLSCANWFFSAMIWKILIKYWKEIEWHLKWNLKLTHAR